MVLYITVDEHPIEHIDSYEQTRLGFQMLEERHYCPSLICTVNAVV